MPTRTGCGGGERLSSTGTNRPAPRVSCTSRIYLGSRLLRSSPCCGDRLTLASAQSGGNRRPLQDSGVPQQPADLNSQAFQQYDLPSSRSNGTAQPAGRPPVSQPQQGTSSSDGYGRPLYSDSRSPDQSRTASSLRYQESSSAYALQRAPQPPVLLSFYDALKGKDIITTAEGTNLGKAEGAIIDSSTMTLEAVTVAENSSSSAAPGFCIPTATLSQVGDVILVSEERAMRRPPAVPEFVSLLGTHVRSTRGTYIGRVKDVDFDPETGAISSIYYDEYGLAWLPMSMQLVNLYGVPTEAVLDVTREEVIIDTRSVWLAMPGKIEGLGKALKSLKLVGGEGDSPVVVAARQSQQLVQWEETYGMTAEEWLERYGDPREAPQSRGRLPEPSARAPPRSSAPPMYQQRSRAEYAEYERGMGPGQLEPPRTGGRRQERERAPAPPARRSRQQQSSRAPEQPQQQQGRGMDPGRQPRQVGRREETETRGDRPAYGSVLQPDPRFPEYEDARGPLLERRRDDAIRSNESI